MDEGFTWLVAHVPLGEVIATTARTEQAPPLYYLATHAFLTYSDGEAAVRAASAMFGVLTVGAVAWLGWTAFGPREGALAAVLLAVSALHVMMSRDARAYSTAAFFVTISSGLMLAELRTPGRPVILVGYALAATAAVYTHYICVFIVAIQAVAGFLLTGVGASRQTRVVVTRRALALGAVALAYAPWIPCIIAQRTRGSAGFIPVVKLHASSTSLFDALFVQAAGFFLNLPSIWVWYGVALAAAALIALPWFLDRHLAARFLAVVCGGTAVTLILVSLPGGLGIYSGKYLVLVSPLFWALAARSVVLLADRGMRAASAAAAVALLLLNVVSTANLLTFDEWRNQDWRGAVEVLARKARTADTALFVPVYATPVMRYYASRLGTALPLVGVDADGAARLTAADLASMGRIWLVEGDPSMVDPDRRVARLLDTSRPRLETWEAYRRNPSLRVRVTLYGGL